MVSKSEIDILITIAIPNYNYGQYIGKTIESAIHQSGDDIEILISDNNSEDNSWEIIQSYVDSRIISFKQNQNIGLQQNWNFLLNKARGKYFILLPSDDLLSENFISIFREKIYNARKNEIGTVIWGFSTIDKLGLVSKNHTALPSNLHCSYSCTFDSFRIREFSTPWAHAQLTNEMIKVGGYLSNSRRLDSLLFYSTLFNMKEKDTVAINEVLAFQRNHHYSQRFKKYDQIYSDNIQYAKYLLESTTSFSSILRVRLFMSKNFFYYLVLNSISLLRKRRLILHSKLNRFEIAFNLILAPFSISLDIMSKVFIFSQFKKISSYINL